VSASARLVVQMTPTEKTSLDQRAQKAGLTTSEFVRRRIGGRDNMEENREEIEALLAAIENAAPNILQTLDDAIAEANALRTAISALDERPAS
jgi:hypothetical protein